MGVHIVSAGIVDAARWERTDPDRPDHITVEEGDTRFTLESRPGGYGVSIQMSYSRWGDLQDYIAAVGAADLLFRHSHILESDEAEEIGPWERTHPIDCRAVADALDAEIASGRHALYCHTHHPKTERHLTPFDPKDIIQWRDFLRVCGGYTRD